MTSRWTAVCAAFLMTASSITGSARAEPTVQYVCGGGASFGATFRDNGETLVLQVGGAMPATLRSAISGSGSRYVGDGYEFHGKGDSAVLIQPGLPPVSCRTATAAAPSRPAPPPPTPAQAGPSFDCAKARAASEIAICRSASLAELDRRMTDAYAWLRGQLRGRERRLLKQDQRRWLRARNACGGNQQCLESAYLERIAAIQEWR